MKVQVAHRCADFNSYRAARVKSLFNADRGDTFDLEADLPIDDDGWRVGLIVGPSGSGKTSIASTLWEGGKIYSPGEGGWERDKPIVDCIAPGASFDEVTGALASVGLGTVPSWLRPYHVLSNGEKFRADLARIICEKPAQVIVDEFTSVVDRQIAKIGASAFSKAWKRTGGQCVLVSCHYDIIDWVEPDWVFDTSTGQYAGRGLWRRPRFDVELWKVDWRYWPMFKPHYYLDLPRMPAAACYVASVDGEPVAHVAIGTCHIGKGRIECRGSRMVVMPEWQGAGVGTRFLDAVCQLQLEGAEGARIPGRKLTTMFHTSHPGLAAALRRSQKWRQVSARLHGENKVKSMKSLARSKAKSGNRHKMSGTGFGGHFRSISGFRYVGASA